MDANKTIEKLKGESNKGKYTLYLTVKVMEEFKEACQPFAPSRVIDELIKDFIESKNQVKAKASRSKSKKSNF